MPKSKQTKVEIEPHIYDQVLAFVNRTRKACGAKPLKVLPIGEPSKEKSCPIATALTIKNQGINAEVHDGHNVILTRTIKIPTLPNGWAYDDFWEGSEKRGINASMACKAPEGLEDLLSAVDEADSILVRPVRGKKLSADCG